MGIFKVKGKYFIDYRVHGRRVREGVGPSRKAAEQALAVRKAEIVQGRYQFRERHRTTFAELAGQYMPLARVNKRSWDRDQSLLTNLLPAFGARRLDDINPLSIEEYKRQRLEKVKPATVNRELALLRHMLNLAVSWKKLASNPMRDVRMLRVDNVQDRILTKKETDALLRACCGHLRPVVITALHTGMRLGEILTLRWGQVDLGQRMVTVLNAKNGKARKIPLNNVMMELLEKIKEGSRSDHVFVSDRTKRPVSGMRTAWLAAIRRSGIARCRFHDLRHTCASRMVAAGVDLVTVKEILGHSTITMTVRYAHSAPESKRKAVEALERVIPETDGQFLDTKAISDKLSKYATHYL